MGAANKFSPFVYIHCLVFLNLGLSQQIQPADTIQHTGPSNNRIDIIFFGDGWSSSRSENQKTTLDSHITTFFEEVPVYHRYKKFFNIYRANHFRTNPPSSKQTRSNFEYYVDKANESISESEVHYIVSDDGGSGEGGNVGMASARLSLTDTDDWNLIGVHEMGHGWHRLGDVYERGGGNGWPNTDAVFNRDKWDRWVGFKEPYNGEIVNYYQIEQSNFYRCVRDIHTMMGHVRTRSWNVVYSPVGREKAVHDFYEIVDPVDDHTPANLSLTDPKEIVLTLVDNEVVHVDWYLDNQLIIENGGEKFIPNEYEILQGSYELKAHVYDEVVKKAFSDRGGQESGESDTFPHDSLDWVRQDLDALQKDIIWDVEFTQDVSPINRVSYYNYIIQSITPKRIELQIWKRGSFNLDLLDVLGNVVQELIENSNGPQTVIDWNTESLTPGSYIIRVSQRGKVSQRKWILVR